MARRDWAETLRNTLGDRGCPLCGEQAWDFEGRRVVFLVEREHARLDKIRGRLEFTGSRTYRENPEQALIQEVFKVFQQAWRNNRLVQLSCSNCGHTELLDARKVGA
jgi:predicted nucleic-acid-binding Zn-ribbon protein